MADRKKEKVATKKDAKKDAKKGLKGPKKLGESKLMTIIV
jgi:hypothetical protein